MEENDSLLNNNNQVSDLKEYILLFNKHWHFGVGNLIAANYFYLTIIYYLFYYQKEKVKDEDMDENELFLLNNNQVFIHFVKYASPPRSTISVYPFRISSPT